MKKIGFFILLGLLLSACGDNGSQTNIANSNTVDTLIKHIDGDSEMIQPVIRFNSLGEGIAVWKAYTGLKAATLFSIYDSQDGSWSPQQLLLNGDQQFSEVAISNTNMAVTYVDENGDWVIADLKRQNNIWLLQKLSVTPNLFNGSVHMAATGEQIMVAWGEQVGQGEPVLIHYALHDGGTWQTNTTQAYLNNFIVDLRVTDSNFVLTTEELGLGGKTAGGQSIFLTQSTSWTHSPPTGTNVSGLDTLFTYDADGICFLRRTSGFDLHLLVYRYIDGWQSEVTLPESNEFPRINNPVSGFARAAKLGDACFLAWYSDSALLLRAYDTSNASWLELNSVAPVTDITSSFAMGATDTHLAILINGISNSLELFDGNSLNSHDPLSVNLDNTGLQRTQDATIRTNTQLLIADRGVDPFVRYDRNTDYGVIDQARHYSVSVQENDIMVALHDTVQAPQSHVVDDFYPSSSLEPMIYGGTSGNLLVWRQYDFSAINASTTKFYAVHVQGGQASAVRLIDNISNRSVSVFSESSGFGLVTEKSTISGNELILIEYKNAAWQAEKTLTSGWSQFKIEGAQVLCWYRLEFVNPDSLFSYYCADLHNGNLQNEQKVYEYVNSPVQILATTQVQDKPVILMLNGDGQIILAWRDVSGWKSSADQIADFSQINPTMIEISGLDNKILAVWARLPESKKVYWAEFDLADEQWSGSGSRDSQVLQDIALQQFNNQIYLFERGVQSTRPAGQLIYRYDTPGFTYITNPIENFDNRISSNAVFENMLYMAWRDEGRFALRSFDGENLGPIQYIDVGPDDIFFPSITARQGSLDASLLVKDETIAARYDILVKQKLY